MESGKKRVGYKLSNALLSPRLLRHRDVTLLAEDVIGDDFALLSMEERKQLTTKTNSCGTINNNNSLPPAFGRTARKLSKIVPRKVSLSSLMSGSQLNRLASEHKYDQSKGCEEDDFRSKLKSEPVPTIRLHTASSSESLCSEYSAACESSSSVKFGLSESEAESEAFSDEIYVSSIIDIMSGRFIGCTVSRSPLKFWGPWG